MPFEDEKDYIHKVCFSNCCDLYILTHESNRKVAIYRIRVGFDTSIEVREGLRRQTGMAMEAVASMEAPDSMLKPMTLRAFHSQPTSRLISDYNGHIFLTCVNCDLAFLYG